MPGWSEVRALVARELGERVTGGRPLTPARPSITWAAAVAGAGAIVVKVRAADEGRTAGKARWAAAQLPVLAGRGYPVPVIWWHGPISTDWHVTVQSRLPGRPLRALDGRLADAVVRLVELQADAGVAAGDRDFTGYVANVLFDDWDEVWADAPRACPAAGPLCTRLRRWLEPVWGLRLFPRAGGADEIALDQLLSGLSGPARAAYVLRGLEQLGIRARDVEVRVDGVRARAQARRRAVPDHVSRRHGDGARAVRARRREFGCVRGGDGARLLRRAAGR